jgi:hypothetical protein
MKCGSCDQMRNKDLYSSAQLKKHGKRRCKLCVEAEASGAPPAGKAKAAAASAAASSSAGAAARPAAASSSNGTAASSQRAAQPSHTLHRHHAGLRHHMANGDEIHSEPEELDGDGVPHNEHIQQMGKKDSDDEDDDDDEDGMDPFAALFGGGRSRARRGGKKAAGKGKRPSMGMQEVLERPGQQLTRDRRLRLKPSKAHPVRCWQPRAGEAVCSECEWRTASRLVQGWRLVCMRCALENDGWMDDDEALRSEDEHEDEDGGGAHAAREARRTDPRRVTYHASTFPSYRAGMACCPRDDCKSARLLLVYDEAGDEFVVCAACQFSKQKLRYFDASQLKLIDSLQEPTTHD